MSGRLRPYLLLLAVLPCAALLTSCGAVNKFRGPQQDAKNDQQAWQVSQQDPLSIPIQVGWTSARARYCGFVFSPQLLRASLMSFEQRNGVTPDQMAKIQHAYDYTETSVATSIAEDPGYCNKSRTDAIRQDLQHYLRGDFTHRATPAD